MKDSVKETAIKIKNIMRTLLFFILPCVLISGCKGIMETTPKEPIALSTYLEKPILGGTVQNAYPSLSIPTQITKIEDDYFLVDCYHNQILTSKSLDTPLLEWSVLTDQIDKGHTIAGDGEVYLADDTENNRILIFEKKDDCFYMTQVFENIGVRPHFVTYDEGNARFYVLSSMTDELYVFGRDVESSTVFLEQILKIPGLDNIYIRSFKVEGDYIYFVACNGQILLTSKKDLSVREIYLVPDELAGMVQLTRIQNYFYLTVSTDLHGNQDYATIVRAKSLQELSDGIYENISELFVGKGTPYYISFFDDTYYLTQHCMIPGSGVYSFKVEEDMLKDIVVLYP